MPTNAWRSLFLQVLAVGRGQGEPGTLLLGCNSIPVRQDAGGHAPGVRLGPALRWWCCSRARLAGQTTSWDTTGQLGSSWQRTGELGVEKGAQQASDPQWGRLLANTHATLQLPMPAPRGCRSTCAWDFLQPPHPTPASKPYFPSRMIFPRCSMPCIASPTPRMPALLPRPGEHLPPSAQRGLCVTFGSLPATAPLRLPAPAVASLISFLPPLLECGGPRGQRSLPRGHRSLPRLSTHWCLVKSS